MDSRVTRRTLGLALVSAALAAACKRQGGKSASSGPLRIVSLAPSMTEMLFALGAGPSVVGRTNQCNYPGEAIAVPAVADFSSPHIESIVWTRPNLVVGPKSPATAKLEEALRERTIASYFQSPERIADIDVVMTELGARVAKAEKAAELRARCTGEVTAIESAMARAEKKRVALLVSARPIYAAGPKSFPGELLSRAGAIHPVDAERAVSPYPAIGLEELLSWDPDVLLDATNMGGDAKRGESSLASLPGFTRLRAVRDAKVVAFSDDRILRPGPRYAEGLRALARVLHPEVTLPKAPAGAVP